MKIKDIRLMGTNQTRTDGKYAQRIGSEVEFHIQPEIGMCMFLKYIKDNKGNDKTGILRTSVVVSVFENESEIVVATYNSIYYFEE